MNKNASEVIEILVKSLAFDGFGRKFHIFSQLAEYLAPRVFGVRQKQNILGLSTRRDLSISGTIS